MTRSDQTNVRGRARDVYRLAGSTYDLKVSLADQQALETPLLPDWKMPLGDLFAA